MRSVEVEFIGGPHDGLVLKVPEGTERYYFPILAKMDWITEDEGPDPRPTTDRLIYRVIPTTDGYKAVLQR